MVSAEIKSSRVGGHDEYAVTVRSRRGSVRGSRTFSRFVGDAVSWARSFAARPEAMRITLDGRPYGGEA